MGSERTLGDFDPALPLHAVVPGLIWAGFFALLSLLSTAEKLPQIGLVHTIGLAFIPWVILIWQRRSPRAFGLGLQHAVSEYGWGMLAGAIWRGLSMGFNLIWLGATAAIFGGITVWFNALVVIPLLEETFYRGYLGPALGQAIGFLPAVLVQAAHFTLAPAHVAQGWPDLAGIFGFGLLSGWLALRRRNLWIAMGAHGFANILPGLLLRWV